MKERLQKDLISAMKEHNRKKADTIKSVKAAIQMEAVHIIACMRIPNCGLNGNILII